jgi:tetratricopeptide (TPR) repeat protein
VAERKTCFVIMGFGKKTDYTTGRVLDLDKSYKYIIKPAAEAANLECTRADEIIHSGIIDVPMYEQLLKADVVVADVSTNNCNAFYELGVRHALRPFTTITIAEDKMIYPFDISHIAVAKYTHLGEGIDFGEVERMRGVLKNAMEVIVSKPVDDSPVYAFIKGLQPPRMVTAAVATDQGTQKSFALAAQPAERQPEVVVTLKVLRDQAQKAMDDKDFSTAISLWTTLRAMVADDPCVVQKLALATYKSKLPDPVAALEKAKALLAGLHPEVSTDTETLGMWGAVHKRLWELKNTRPDLDTAIFSYEKGFYLKNDYYNGINLAYLLNVRSSISPPAEAIADFVQAQRTRRQVIRFCQERLDLKHQPVDREEECLAQEERYWVLATMAEAHRGLGDEANAKNCLDRALALNPANWMKESTETQMESLRKLLENSPLKLIRQD